MDSHISDNNLIIWAHTSSADGSKLGPALDKVQIMNEISFFYVGKLISQFHLT